jgi:hypothetical protein
VYSGAAGVMLSTPRRNTFMRPKNPTIKQKHIDDSINSENYLLVNFLVGRSEQNMKKIVFV